MDAETRSIQVEGAADLALVERVLDALDGLWITAPEVPGEDQSLFRLAIAEISTNVVTHSEGHVTMSVSARVTPGTLHALIQDTAAPVTIELAAAAMPDAEAESGRGLALAR
ncbi:MAG TPA: ATP-binding protein, partial [Vicinamibacterales bacterium]|nr:ATP-binding protein [Vicinamibacterales bacterium]